MCGAIFLLEMIKLYIQFYNSRRWNYRLCKKNNRSRGKNNSSLKISASLWAIKSFVSESLDVQIELVHSKSGFLVTSKNINVIGYDTSFANRKRWKLVVNSFIQKALKIVPHYYETVSFKIKSVSKRFINFHNSFQSVSLKKVCFSNTLKWNG